MKTIFDYLWNNSGIIAAFLGGSVILISLIKFFDFLLSSRMGSYRRIFDELSDVKQSIRESKEMQLAEAVDKKKEGFLNIPNISFHFANKDEIQSFYNDYFKEPTVEQIVAEMATELGGEAKARFPKILETKIGGKDISKWISTIKLPDISVSEMFRRYQRETIKNNQVMLGLELVEIDLSDLNILDKLVAEFNSKFNLILDDPKIDGLRTALRKRASEKTMVRLENASGAVLLEGKFKILSLPEDFYKCVYYHPVNEYFTEGSNNITISFILKKFSLEPSIAGNYAQSVGKSIPLRVYGKIWQPIDRKADVWDLQITPIAVY
jgi:hypothetical protein